MLRCNQFEILGFEPMSDVQQHFGYSPIRNKALFSSHWLENRLRLEPEWNELRDEAIGVLTKISKLWTVQKSRVQHLGNEQSLEYAFIQPVFEELGWKLIYQTFLSGGKPDYALFAEDHSLDAALQAGKKSPDFWAFPKLVADAKTWDLSLDHPAIIEGKHEYPPQQIERYLDRSHLDFAILTNGKFWRLIPRELQPQQRRFQTYLECELPKILDGWLDVKDSIIGQTELIDDFLRFYLFFSPVAFRVVDGGKTLIARAIEGSSEYRVGVGEGLKSRAFEALRFCMEGFLGHAPNNLDSDADLNHCRQQSFILLYRLLFIMFAEDRRLLPYRVNKSYTDNRSLGSHRDSIATKLDRSAQGREDDYSMGSTAIWEDLSTLFDLIDSGHARYSVPAYNGGLFNQEEHPFLVDKKLSDWHSARVIDQLGRALDPEKPKAGLFRVDYRDLAIQHLGSIYEGLLELSPVFATEDMVVVIGTNKGRTIERVQRATDPIPKGFRLTDSKYGPGSIYLQTDKGERRATGSYYTPDHIVDYIIERTLRPICFRLAVDLQSEVTREEEKLKSATSPGEESRQQAKLDSLREDYGNRVLALRVLDPAMGSGHFLIRACQYLAEEIATNPYTAAAVNGQGDEPAMTHWKRRVVENCLFGVDMNDLAVELAKLALWLETVAKDQPLTFLDHHLRPGNSLVGAKIEKLGILPGELELRANNFAKQVETHLPVFLKPLAEIRQAPSETASQIKAKERLYRTFEKAREPFLALANLWLSTFVAPKDGGPGNGDGSEPREQDDELDDLEEDDDEEDDDAESDRPDGGLLSDEQYQKALNVLAKPRLYKALIEEPWFIEATRRLADSGLECFHWELGFPEVFFSDTGRRAKPGFDAVIGNPPYEVLSEKESGRDLSAFRAFLKRDPMYRPSKGGKNNLYKLFICRVLDLLADGGYFGFIVPMVLLGDKQALGIRKRIVEVGSFTVIEAFEEKDKVKHRVFPEAKLATTVFAMVKGKGRAVPNSFQARVHESRFVDTKAEGITLSTASIPLYDPTNFTIVTRHQADWDLAIRIIKDGRMDRLSHYCTSYQGEVNEKRDKRYLSRDEACGPLIMRGSNICLYAVRDASQGQDFYLNVADFFKGKKLESKAFHSKVERIGFQRSSPQNNFRRIIAARMDAGNFCFDTVSYIPITKAKLPLSFLAGLLNSKLLDWYFRLGSTNSKVNEYQFNNLPCPVFAEDSKGDDERLREEVLQAIEDEDLAAAFDTLKTKLVTPPFSPIVRDVIVDLVDRIMLNEAGRGDIARTKRSALDPDGQPYQDLIDRYLFAMAGLTDAESIALQGRLSRMR
jgi:hypothetical protein